MRTKWYLFGCLTSVLLVMLFIFLLVNTLTKLATKTPTMKIENNSVLYLDLKGQIQDYTEITDMNFSFLPTSAHDIVQKINTAENDIRIRAILLEPQAIMANRATVNEIIKALNDFKATGKKVYGYISNATQADINLLGAADEVYMNPSNSAGFIMYGAGGAFGYYKDLLDKLGIEVRVIRAGEYKSAGESFNRSSMSLEMRRNMDMLYADIYSQMINDYSRNFNTSPVTFRYVFESREELIINGRKAMEYGIVDELIHFDRLLTKLDIKEEQLVKHTRYIAETPRQHVNRIAVIYAQGNITPTQPQFGESNINSKQFIQMLETIEKDRNIKAVVIRVNSPGGSAMESEVILSKIEELKKVKPVVISMGGIAASGGYYIAANANYIYADPYTITGSIGVISMIPDLSGSAKNIGINTELLGHGKFLSVNDMWNAWSTDLEKGMEIMTTQIYDEFKNRVAQGRNMSLNDVERIAQGQVWSANAALQYRLIDGIGGLTDAVKKAAEIASIERYSLDYFPERKSMLATLFENQFSFSMARLLMKNELPATFAKPIDEGLNLLNDIMIHPVQMRSEIIFE